MPPSDPPAPGSASPFTDRQLGDYLLERPLGVGRLGEAWQARKVGVAGSFVVRRLPPFLCEDRTAVDRFFEALRPLRALDHPNLARLVDHGRVGEICYLATEYVDGPSLAEGLRAQRTPLPPALAAELIAQAGEGLAYAHGVLARAPAHPAHGELCPESLRITTSGLVRILDFGLARAATALTVVRVAPDRPAFRFLAPELVRGAGPEATERSDLYSLGATLLALVTGRRPFEEIDDPVDFAYRLCQAGLPAAASEAAPPALRDILRRATATAPAARPASAAELIGALDAYLKTTEPVPQLELRELILFWAGRGEDPRLRAPKVIVSPDLMGARPAGA